VNDQMQQYYGYYPSQYQPLGAVVAGLMGLIMLVAMGAWALSLVKKALRDEPVEYPGGHLR
jgi:putative exporter of polyketide antibiotics